MHKIVKSEEVSKFSGKLNSKSASSSPDSEFCDENGAVKKPVIATGKPLLDRVSQTTPQFVQEKGVTVSESSFDSTSIQGITSQSKSIKPLRVCEDGPESITVVIKEFENGEVDQIDGGEVNISDSGHDSADLSWVDHDEMRGMPTTSEFNKDPVQLRNMLS
ncbi:unnamed protein product [Trichobilharzia regenti]|nr:unnamed protein product [Trichobilharzia regenti]